MDIDTHNELETKAGIPFDAVVTHGDMMRAFEAFQEAHDERLAKRQRYRDGGKARPHPPQHRSARLSAPPAPRSVG